MYISWEYNCSLTLSMLVQIQNRLDNPNPNVIVEAHSEKIVALEEELLDELDALLVGDRIGGTFDMKDWPLHIVDYVPHDARLAARALASSQAAN